MKNRKSFGGLILCAFVLNALMFVSCNHNQTTAALVLNLTGSVTAVNRSADPDSSGADYSLFIYENRHFDREEENFNDENFYFKEISGSSDSNSIFITVEDVPVGIDISLSQEISSAKGRFIYRNESFLVKGGVNEVPLSLEVSEGTDPQEAPSEEEGLASIGSTYYKTLQEAFTAASQMTDKNVTIKLNKSTTVMSPLQYAETGNSAIKLDLGSNSIYWAFIISSSTPFIEVPEGRTLAITGTEITSGIYMTALTSTAAPLFTTARDSNLALENVILGTVKYSGTLGAVITAGEGSNVFLSNVKITGNSAITKENMGIVYAKNAALYAKNTTLISNTGYYSSGIYLDNSKFAFIGGIIQTGSITGGESLIDPFADDENKERASALYVTSTDAAAGPTEDVAISNTRLFSTITDRPVVVMNNGSHLNMTNGVKFYTFDFESLLVIAPDEMEGNIVYESANDLLGTSETETLIYSGSDILNLDLANHVVQLGNRDSKAYLHMADKSAVLGVVDLYEGSQIQITGENDFSRKTKTADGTETDYNVIASVNFVDGVEMFTEDLSYRLRPIFFADSLISAPSEEAQLTALTEFKKRFFIRNSLDDEDASDYEYGYAHSHSTDDSMYILYPARVAKTATTGGN